MATTCTAAQVAKLFRREVAVAEWRDEMHPPSVLLQAADFENQSTELVIQVHRLDQAFHKHFPFGQRVAMRNDGETIVLILAWGP